MWFYTESSEIGQESFDSFDKAYANASQDASIYRIWFKTPTGETVGLARFLLVRLRGKETYWVLETPTLGME